MLRTAFSLLAYQRGEMSVDGITGALLFAELLETVQLWRKAHTK